MFSASRDQMRREYNNRAWMAWTTAMLGRTKKMPPLSRLEVKERRVQSWQEQYAIMQSWYAKSQIAEQMRKEMADGR